MRCALRSQKHHLQTARRFNPFTGRFESSHCQQKRQQRCWQSAGSGSGGVVLYSSAKWGIFSAETTLEATDSDPRLQVVYSKQLTETKSTAFSFNCCKEVSSENRPSPSTPSRSHLASIPCSFNGTWITNARNLWLEYRPSATCPPSRGSPIEFIDCPKC